MHTVTLSEPIVIKGFALDPGTPYLMADTMAGSLLTNRALVRCADGRQRPVYRLVTVQPYEARPIDSTQDYNGRSVWFFRMGGYGDVLMATPVIAEVRRRWPRCSVYFVTMPQYAPALYGAECFIHAGFVPADRIAPDDAVVFFEGVIEDNPRAEEVHAVDLLAERAGVSLPDDWRIRYSVLDAEREWAAEQFPRGDKPRVAIQVTASSGVRSYVPQFLFRVIEKLVREGMEIFLFGEPGKVECDPMPGVLNLADLSEPPDFRQSVAILATCDVALVPDSSLQHVAGAIGVPTVALFGSFPGRLRVAPNAPVRVIEGEGLCAPCFHHESGRDQFPVGAPCELAGFCTVLAGISPESIVRACLAMKDQHVRTECPGCNRMIPLGEGCECGFDEFANTETKRPVLSPGLDQNAESPEGPGRDGNKPQMQNRAANEEPSPKGSYPGDTF